MSTSLIQITNATSDRTNAYLAFYQKSSPGSTWPIVVWRYIVSAPQVPSPMSVPTNYAVATNYIMNGVGYQTPPLPISNLTGSFQVSKSGQKIVMTTAIFPVPPKMVSVYVDGSTDQNVTTCVTLGGANVYPPTTVIPNVTLSIAMNTQLYVALVKIGTKAGTILEASQVSPSEHPVNPGQTVYITGSAKAGYTMAIK